MSHEWQRPIKTNEETSFLENPTNAHESKKLDDKLNVIENVELGEKIVSNLELGITYRETVNELASHRQKEYGIKKIRRRELINYPDDLKDAHVSYPMGEVPGYSVDAKHWPVYDYLTDGRFTSFETLNHKMFADTRKEHRDDLLEKFKKDSYYFQKYNTKKNLDVSYGPQVWGGKNLDVPLFFFSNKNKSFVNYLNSILSNEEIARRFKKSEHEGGAGWQDGKIEFVKDVDSKLYLYAAGLIGATNFEYNPEKLSDGKKAIQKLLKEKNVDVFIRRGHGDISIEIIKMLLDGEKFYSGTGHTSIPTIAHPDVPDLRWCHSEFAIIPTKKTLNVLFFET